MEAGWRSWIDDSSFYWILDGWRRVLRNAAEEGTILRNNSGSTSSRSNSAVLPRLSTQIGRVFCPSSDPRYDDRPTDFCNWTYQLNSFPGREAVTPQKVISYSPFRILNLLNESSFFFFFLCNRIYRGDLNLQN